LRRAEAKFPDPGFNSVTGISGSPVYDLTSNVLCGMVHRGKMKGADCSVLYIDAHDIRRFLRGVSEHAPSIQYVKKVLGVPGQFRPSES
jgi:hypothetical protein